MLTWTFTFQACSRRELLSVYEYTFDVETPHNYTYVKALEEARKMLPIFYSKHGVEWTIKGVTVYDNLTEFVTNNAD
tara:strand:+ start:153 stop:383 length:231 start_codon:yes stop_codon:yes gene_type:complete